MKKKKNRKRSLPLSLFQRESSWQPKNSGQLKDSVLLYCLKITLITRLSTQPFSELKIQGYKTIRLFHCCLLVNSIVWLGDKNCKQRDYNSWSELFVYQAGTVSVKQLLIPSVCNVHYEVKESGSRIIATNVNVTVLLEFWDDIKAYSKRWTVG